MSEFHSGFVAIMGRPNVGKSTLLNRLCGEKVAITSDKVQTTRTQIRGILNRASSQVVFVDTPGIHKPRTALGERLNATASSAVDDVDVHLFVIDARQPFGRGDRFVAAKLPTSTVVAVNKIDGVSKETVLGQLAAVGELGFSEYFPVSAQTGRGVDALAEALIARMPEGPAYYPTDIITDTPDPTWVAELVREQLLRITKDEVPHSVATRVTEWEWPVIRCEIVVERDSQKGIVIGKGGDVLKRVGIAVRRQLPEGVFIELHVVVDKDWQHRPDAIERLGY
jgi:GTPase